MIVRILAAGLIGAVGGALGGLLGGLVATLFRLRKTGSDRRQHLGPLIGGVLGLMVLSASGLRDRLARAIDPPTPMESLGQEIMAIPGMQERLRGKSPQEVQAITQAMSAAGMLKLDDSHLIRRARTVSQMLSKTDERTCAGFATSSLSADDFIRMMASLSDEQRKLWFSTVRAAVEAEAGAAPVATQASPTNEQIADAMTELQKQLPDADQSRFANNLGKLASLPPVEACWTVRTLYSMVDNSSGSTQATVARALVMQ